MLALAVAIAGCASQRNSNGASTATPSPSSIAARHNSGWYLVQPPMRHGNPDTGAKLADWRFLAFFDRASQCDAAREQGLSAYAAYVPASASTTMDSVQLSQRLALSTLCVAAKDPRINWFHIKWK
jgi:hypothetical protein